VALSVTKSILSISTPPYYVGIPSAKLVICLDSLGALWLDTGPATNFVVAIRKVSDTSSMLSLADNYDRTLSAGVTFVIEGDYEVIISASVDPTKKPQGSPLNILV